MTTRYGEVHNPGMSTCRYMNANYTLKINPTSEASKRPPTMSTDMPLVRDDVNSLPTADLTGNTQESTGTVRVK
jgi:hypothetical protein